MRCAGVVVAAVLAVPVFAADKKPPPPELVREHSHPAGAFSIRTPGSWTFGAVPERSGLFEAVGDGLRVRFLFEDREVGYDALHASCMLERLLGEADTDPRVKYEHDFLSGDVGNRRVLDSAFVVRYDREVFGHREWRQRNMTFVGEGQSLCVISHVPTPLWKKAATRTLLDLVLKSLTWRAASR